MPISIGENPLPFPNVANNEHCMPRAEVPADMFRMRCDPFIRLISIPTKTFVAKHSANPCAPEDSLDRALSACYDHHRQWWVPKPGVVMQCETYRLFPFGRAQARLCRLQCLPERPLTQPCPLQAQNYVNHEPYRNDTSHIDSNIGSARVSNSTPGYDRNSTGALYNP